MTEPEAHNVKVRATRDGGMRAHVGPNFIVFPPEYALQLANAVVDFYEMNYA